MGCEGCARAILMAFNVIFFLVGAVALAMGIWVLIDGTILLDLLSKIPGSEVYGSLISDAAYILIAAGGFIFVLAFFGCCGAWKKNKCLLMIYAIIIGILVLLEIGCVVVAYFFYDKVVGIITGGLVTALNDTYDSTWTAQSAGSDKYDYVPGTIISKGIDGIQIEFSCCGVNNYTDYYNDMYPASCCPPKDATDLKGLVNTLWKDTMTTYTVANASCPTDVSAVANTPGCLDAIKNYILEKSIIFMAVGGGTLGVQILLIIFACCVGCNAGKENEVV